MSCEQHKKEVAGISDMKVLAEMIGDLHYESLATFLNELAIKVGQDGRNDFAAKKENLGYTLMRCAYNLKVAHSEMAAAWKISKPFMENKTNNNHDTK